MGLVLTEVKEGDKKGLKISDISPQGKAGKAGLQKDDILIAINSTTINSMEDVRLTLLNNRVGDHVKLRILRQKEGQESEEKEVELELSNLEMTKPHP